MNWQPIETAPKDGESLLLWSRVGGFSICYWSNAWGFWRTDAADECHRPTHWAHLAPPDLAHSEEKL